MQLSIIIVSYNVKHFLEQCLCSVKKAIRGIRAEVIVIDNNSADDSVNYLQTVFPGVRFIHLQGHADLAHVAQTRDAPGLFLGLGKCGQEEPRQNGDNGDDDQQFDQRKTGTRAFHDRGSLE